MRRLLPLSALVTALVCGPGVARADDMDGWCAQAKKASSIVICYDVELRQQANARARGSEDIRPGRSRRRISLTLCDG